MTIDMLIDGILDSYHRYGLINRSDSDSFPNRQNVVEILGDIQTLIFPVLPAFPRASLHIPAHA